MSQYQTRRNPGLCPNCGGPRTTKHVYCEECRNHKAHMEARSKAAHREMWFASPTQRLYSFIVRGGKISPKGAPLG
jgi:hypothetical protein